jgi:hypothetical protein
MVATAIEHPSFEERKARVRERAIPLRRRVTPAGLGRGPPGSVALLEEQNTTREQDSCRFATADDGFRRSRSTVGQRRSWRSI